MKAMSVKLHIKFILDTIAKFTPREQIPSVDFQIHNTTSEMYMWELSNQMTKVVHFIRKHLRHLFSKNKQEVQFVGKKAQCI